MGKNVMFVLMLTVTVILILDVILVKTDTLYLLLLKILTPELNVISALIMSKHVVSMESELTINLILFSKQMIISPKNF
jgi:hypothetical protein